MAGTTTTRRLQRRIVLCSSFGILCVGIIVSLVSTVPLYNHLKREQEHHLSLALTAKAKALEEYLRRDRELLQTFGRQTIPPRDLAYHERGKTSSPGMPGVTEPALKQFLGLSPEAIAIRRVNHLGRLLIEAGSTAGLFSPLVKDVPSDAEFAFRLVRSGKESLSLRCLRFSTKQGCCWEQISWLSDSRT
jgi:hypothetical protein